MDLVGIVNLFSIYSIFLGPKKIYLFKDFLIDILYSFKDFLIFVFFV